LDPHDRAQQWLSLAGNEVGRSRYLNGSACTAMEHADGVNRAVHGIDAREGEPMIARELPRD
jgi:hypothetical protein